MTVLRVFLTLWSPILPLETMLKDYHVGQEAPMTKI